MASEVMTLQAQAGKRADSGFKKEAWTEALAAFNNRFQTKLSRQQIKSRLTALKGIYTSIKAMLDASGFGWDDERHVVLVHDSVWDDYVKLLITVGRPCHCLTTFVISSREHMLPETMHKPLKSRAQETLLPVHLLRN
ncbi:hypothetical protein F442_15795 [Phytophthora nicotianae P10297]|uniref:Myb/SANT-like domain-containing protein n=4 Tax=Phytophthora nicotianae TaxID=4792 RepID=V9EI73_PHYNI|nr:hypothetical protein F443_15951 [Phytophthora nicotianae P1569]ETL85154.1 hypothetical protein L917_15222 [Phytophthora nicotianae]ETM38316.1 hypothetical protein L914_15363 [Phytophthora nicotianae]ETO67058.1 hypothetical protein F444_15932 [Phytophthora nicotianae P1976]ETP36230.1 hypothetical protein F442_15795 [Phytophthora nicotianae P10297]